MMRNKDIRQLQQLLSMRGLLAYLLALKYANRLSSLIKKKPDETIIASYVFPAQPEGLDAVGNITQSVQDEPLTPVFNPEVTNYTYNAQKTRLLNAGSDTFTYDNEGQLATGYGSTYTFDYEHRLKNISGAFNADYFYDGTGNRLKAIRAGVTTKYIYDINGNVIGEADNNNSITNYYVHGMGLMSLITSSDVVYTYHFNNIGSTIVITDQAQAIVNKYSYDPFGTILNQVETIQQPFKYVGRFGVMAEQNGFYYMVTRYYDSKTGIFTSEDTIGFAGGDANLKRYVGNDPVNSIDPLGLAKMCCRLLDSIIGTRLKQRHCYIIADDGTRYGLYPEKGKGGNNIGVPRTNDPRDSGGDCYECPSLSNCENQNECLKKAHNSYPVGLYGYLSPNSNTYAGTLARTCCKGGVPKGVKDAPGINDKPPTPCKR